MKKTIEKQKKYSITLFGGTKLILGQGNLPTSHEGVSAKDFSKALAKAAKAVSEAGIFDSDGSTYDNRLHTTVR